MRRWEGTWIYIDFLTKRRSGKTNVYQVMSKDGDFLGDIKWYAPWRKYTFFPGSHTLYEYRCLQDITKFLLHAMKQFKNRRIE